MKNKKEAKVKYLAIAESDLQEILNYLGKCPAAQVIHLIPKIQSAKPVLIEDEKKK